MDEFQSRAWMLLWGGGGGSEVIIHHGDSLGFIFTVKDLYHYRNNWLQESP